MTIDLGFGPIPIGTLPQWAVVAAVVVALIKAWPVIHQQVLTHKTARDMGWQQECKDLRAELRMQRQECEEEHERSRKKIQQLEETISGLRRQHVQEQISLINSILRSVDSPELQNLVKMLENVQDTLLTQRIIAGEAP